MTQKNEKSNISEIADTYIGANFLAEGWRDIFEPYESPEKIGNICLQGVKLLNSIKVLTPDIWNIKSFAFSELSFPKKLPIDPWEQNIHWTTLLNLWGEALDIQAQRINGGTVDNWYREKLENLTIDEGYKFKDSDIEWLKKERIWIKNFYDCSLSLIDEIANHLSSLLKRVSVNENPTARLALIENFLRVTEYNFFRSVQATGPYMSPDAFDFPEDCCGYWNDGTVDVELGSHIGTLRTELIGGGKIRCSFEPDGQSPTRVKWTLDTAELIYGYNRQSYKRELFDTWNYTTGKLLCGWKTDKRAFWFLGSGTAFEAYVEHVIELSLPLFKNSDYEKLARNIIKTVTNDQPEFWPGEVQWSYVAELDRMIQECRLARNIYYQVNGQIPFLFSIKSNKVIKPAIQIPSESKSPPMTLKELAEYFSTTVPKVKTMIRLGSIKAEEINRQSYFFDMTSLPLYVRKKIQKRVKI